MKLALIGKHFDHRRRGGGRWRDSLSGELPSRGVEGV